MSFCFDQFQYALEISKHGWGGEAFVRVDIGVMFGIRIVVVVVVVVVVAVEGRNMRPRARRFRLNSIIGRCRGSASRSSMEKQSLRF